MISLNLNYSSKALFSTTVTLRLRALNIYGQNAVHTTHNRPKLSKGKIENPSKDITSKEIEPV